MADEMVVWTAGVTAYKVAASMADVTADLKVTQKVG